MSDAGQEWGEYRLMILDRLGRIENSINSLTTHINTQHSTLDVRVGVLEREWANAKGRSAAWSALIAAAVAILSSVVVAVVTR